MIQVGRWPLQRKGAVSTIPPRSDWSAAHAHVPVFEGEHYTYLSGRDLVLEGTMSILLDDRWIEAPAGSFVLAPAGTTHDFENRSAVAPVS
jgi:mannose-6-phosphate isomerase-like protein (cupin superfamily)